MSSPLFSSALARLGLLPLEAHLCVCLQVLGLSHQAQGHRQSILSPLFPRASLAVRPLQPLPLGGSLQALVTACRY